MKTKKHMSVVLVMTIFLSLIATAAAGVRYPVIGPNLRNNINIIRSNNIFIGSEFIEIWQDEYVAITIPNHTDGGVMCSVGFTPVPELVEFKEPVLTIYNTSVTLKVENGQGYFTYDDGSKEIYGYANYMGQKILFYSWSWFDDAGEEQWATSLTWGNLSDIDEPGTEIDRTTMGRLISEPHNCGYEIIATDFKNNSFKIGAVFDSDAVINLESSTDLRSWTPISADIEVVPDSYEFFDGIGFLGAVITPNLTSELSKSSKVFFRLR